MKKVSNISNIKCLQKYWRLNKNFGCHFNRDKIPSNHKTNVVYLALIAYHKLKSEAICFPNWNSWIISLTVLIGKSRKMPRKNGKMPKGLTSKLFQSKFYRSVMAAEFINDFTGILVGKADDFSYYFKITFFCLFCLFVQEEKSINLVFSFMSREQPSFWGLRA